MDPLASGTLAPRVAGPPPGAPLPSARASLPGLETVKSSGFHSIPYTIVLPLNRLALPQITIVVRRERMKPPRIN
ncbi:coordinator of PRMT5 and differentiation stimulator isoform X2 [Dipodomys merriami]|uniref:coordinator of PRMT5 and differentiation stimulator isoform X2 n=1 Tax=Dipodomys merriami TaxID=94247 RepID=UPI003856033C